MPRVSPDGHLLAYIDRASGEPEVKVMDLATGATSTIAIVEASFDWLSDGSGFLGTTGGCSGDPIVIGLDGSTWKPFSESGRQAFMDIDWNTDRMFYTSDPCWSPNTATRVYDSVTGTAITIQAPDGRSEGGGNVSPDGTLLTYMKHDSGYSNPSHVYVMNVDGSGDYRLTTTTGIRDFLPVFSPDGSRVAFTTLVASSPGLSEVWVIGLDGTSLTKIVEGTAMHRTSGWVFMELCSFGPEEPLIFKRERGRPTREMRSWESCGGLGTLVISNAGVSAAWAFLNGDLILHPADLNQDVERIELAIELLEGENSLEVKLHGKPGGELAFEFFASDLS
jgi:hypothetical protein